MNDMLPKMLACIVSLSIVMLAALTGFGFLLAALYAWLTELLPIWGSALVVAGVCFVVAVAAVISIRIIMSAQQSALASADGPAEEAAGGASAIADLAYDLGRIGADRVRENPQATMAAALVAGVVMGASPGARRQLFNLIDRILH